jgi:hypothetical protein
LNYVQIWVSQTKKAFQKESLSLASIGLMLQPDSNHRDWNPTQRCKDSKGFGFTNLFPWE